MVNKKKKLKKIGSLKKRKQEHIEKIENFEAEIEDEKADLNGK